MTLSMLLCCVSFMLNVVMLCVSNKPFILFVFIPECRYAECRYAECRGVASTPAYYNTATILTVKGFIVQAPKMSDSSYLILVLLIRPWV
jgi:hypothetical protein